MATKQCFRCGGEFSYPDGAKPKPSWCTPCCREYEQIRVYGISYEQAVERQGSETCALCGKPERAEWNGVVTNLCIDHNHSSGKVRGLLCRGCNYLVGRIEKMDPDWVDRAVKYLHEDGVI